MKNNAIKIKVWPLLGFNYVAFWRKFSSGLLDLNHVAFKEKVYSSANMWQWDYEKF